LPLASYRFGEFRLDCPGMRLLRAGAAVEIEPKALRALVHLVEHPGRLVTKQELLDAVWGGVSVTDNSLTRAVAQVRKALGDDARAPRFVETAHAFGYRFIGEIETERCGAAGAAAPGQRIAPEPSVAVLPFLDLSPARDLEYLCDGITEELTDMLTQLPGLRVASRTSAFAYKARPENVCEIGRRLGVGAVLEGSVRRADERMRVTVQLVSASDGYHLWSERFDRPEGDLFALQDEIALGVAERLRVEWARGDSWPATRGHKPGQEAYRLYLKGRYLFNRRAPADLGHAIGLFEEAVAADPAWALPHLGLAEIFAVLGRWGFLPPHPACTRARREALHALELDDSLAEAHLCAADMLFLYDWDWSAALDHLERARGNLPAEGYGRFVLAMFDLATGRPDEAARLAHLQVEADPASAIAHEQAAAVLIGLGKTGSAAPLLERALELDAELTTGLFWLGFCRGVEGRFEEAAELLRETARRGLASARFNLPAVLVRIGRTEEAREIVEDLERGAARRYISPVERLCGWAALGERERCRRLFAEAERERCPTFTIFAFAPGFLALAPAWLREWFELRRRDLTAEIRLAAANRELGAASRPPD
jgi:adenylate cyclase